MNNEYLDLQYKLEQAAYRLAVAVESKIGNPDYCDDAYLLECAKEVREARQEIINYLRGGRLQEFRQQVSERLLADNT